MNFEFSFKGMQAPLVVGFVLGFLQLFWPEWLSLGGVEPDLFLCALAVLASSWGLGARITLVLLGALFFFQFSSSGLNFLVYSLVLFLQSFRLFSFAGYYLEVLISALLFSLFQNLLIYIFLTFEGVAPSVADSLKIFIFSGFLNVVIALLSGFLLSYWRSLESPSNKYSQF